VLLYKTEIEVHRTIIGTEGEREKEGGKEEEAVPESQTRPRTGAGGGEPSRSSARPARCSPAPSPHM
jgi:hypothetical protein